MLKTIGTPKTCGASATTCGSRARAVVKSTVSHAGRRMPNPSRKVLK